MTIATGDHLRIVVGGAISTENWSVGWWQRLAGLTGVPSPAGMNTAAGAYLSAFVTTLWSAGTGPLAFWNATGTNVSFCKLYLYRAGVLAEGGSATVTPVAGTGTAPHPSYVACCVTTLTGSAGKSNRGRLYLPATAIAVSAATSQVSASSNVTALATNAGAVLGSGVLTTFPGSPTATSEVMSILHGTAKDITSVRVDSILDTQHGRSRRLIAASTGTAAVV